ncbi:MAG: hypothetical protein WBD40_19505 [Tepidisphaeraceae bacterium]
MTKTILISVFLSLAATTQLRAQILQSTEAELAKVTCKAGDEPAPNLFATNGKTTPAFWGRESGDEVAWTVMLKGDVAEPRLMVRYSFAAAQYEGFSGARDVKRILHLFVDDASAPIEVPVPNTGWWDLFEPADVALPKLSKGLHKLRLVGLAAHVVTNVDSMIIYAGPIERIPPQLRSSTIARSENERFVLRATPKAAMKLRPEKVFAEFDRIFELYEKFMGWAPPTPVPINLVEEPRWPNPGATSFQNNGGVWFRAGVMHTEQGNWCHEMTHMFYVAHFPWWFDESSVRTLTTFVWVPALYARTPKPETDPTYRDSLAAGRDVLKSPAKRFDNVDAIHYALVARHGPEVFSRFFHRCVDAGKKGELDFTPGRHLKRDEIVKYMSAAAGEDVAPLYRQWTGFDAAE